jgi:L-lactate dehydrogenase (cytochrome)
MAVITCLSDLRDLARRRIPKAMFEFAVDGAHEQLTLRANRRDLSAIQFRQRVGIDVSNRSMSTTILGQDASMPLALGPTGLCGLYRANGEILAARAAHAFGIPFCLGTMSICPIEEVQAQVQQPFWFQLYAMRDRSLAQSLIERAMAARCPVLLLAMDTPVPSERYSDFRNGVSVPPRVTMRNVWDLISKPAWTWNVLFGRHRAYGNLVGHMPGHDQRRSLVGWMFRHGEHNMRRLRNLDSALTWGEVETIRRIWPGKLVLKGVLDAADAKTAAACGADGIIVSNHGGRNLDGAPSTISVLPEIVEAVGDKVEVLFDSGIESGHDVLKALALGARACLIGRAYLYGLAAMGEAGVTRTLDIMRKELDICMAMTGTCDLRKVARDILRMDSLPWAPKGAATASSPSSAGLLHRREEERHDERDLS